MHVETDCLLYYDPPIFNQNLLSSRTFFNVFSAEILVFGANQKFLVSAEQILEFLRSL